MMCIKKKFGKKLEKCFLFLIVVGLTMQSGCTRKKSIGNQLRVALRSKYKTLDPALAQDLYSSVAISRTYEALYAYDYLKRPYKIIPRLASELPTISKDGRVYTIKLKEGVFFHEDPCFEGGKKREVVATDVLYSLLRLADPKTQASGWWILNNKVEGLNEWREKAVKTGSANYSEKIEGLKALDSRTVQIKLKKPVKTFLHLLTMSYSFVVPKEAVEKYGIDFARHPVGTGPFRLKEMQKSRLVWEKNPTFRLETYQGPGEDNGKPLPLVDQLVDDIIEEDQPIWLNFLQGNHDYLRRLTKDNVTQVLDKNRNPTQEISRRDIAVLTEPALDFNYVAFNQNDPIVGGAKNFFLRKAMSLAIDEVPLIEAFYLGLATPAQSIVPPGLPGYDAKYKNPNREYNLAEGIEVLRKAGHLNGEGIPELKLMLPENSSNRQMAEFYVRQWNKLGLKIQVEQPTYPEMLGRIAKKQAQIWINNWYLDYPDVENAWQVLYGPNEAPGANATNYKNAEFDQIFEKYSATGDVGLNKKLRALIEKDMPLIPVVHRMETRLSHAWVKNLVIHAFEPCVERYLSVKVLERDKALAGDKLKGL